MQTDAPINSIASSPLSLIGLPSSRSQTPPIDPSTQRLYLSELDVVLSRPPHSYGPTTPITPKQKALKTTPKTPTKISHTPTTASTTPKTTVLIDRIRRTTPNFQGSFSSTTTARIQASSSSTRTAGIQESSSSTTTTRIQKKIPFLTASLPLSPITTRSTTTTTPPITTRRTTTTRIRKKIPFLPASLPLSPITTRSTTTTTSPITTRRTTTSTSPILSAITKSCSTSKALSVNEFRSEMSNLKQFLKMRFERELSGTDCGDKFCTLSYHLKTICIVFEPTENENCSIPCKLSGCRTEMHKMVQCPVWSCEETSTTTSQSPTTATSTAPSPFPPIPPIPTSHIVLFTSLAINCLVFACLCLGIWWCLRKRLLRRSQRQDTELT